MKRARLALFLSVTAAVTITYPALAQGEQPDQDSRQSKDKSGVTLLAGIVSYDSYIGAALEADAGSDKVFKFGADYTFSNGIILGLDTTGLQELDSDKAFGTANVFTGYELDSGIRLKAGLGWVIIDDQAASEISTEAGYTLGLGYAFDNGVVVEAAYTHINFKGEQYGNTAIAIGYKF